jgi:hypothetical protein
LRKEAGIGFQSEAKPAKCRTLKHFRALREADSLRRTTALRSVCR